MKVLILLMVIAWIVSGPALAQATSPLADKVTPSNNNATGEAGKFGMNNNGNPKTGAGLQGGSTTDTYNWLQKKEHDNDKDMKKREAK